MARRISNRTRLQRLQEEKQIEADEKKEKRPDEPAAAKKKKAKKAPAAKRTRKAPEPAGRMKVVWAVAEPGKDPKATFPFPEKAKAEAEAARLTAKHGKTFLVRRDRVAME